MVDRSDREGEAIRVVHTVDPDGRAGKMPGSSGYEKLQRMGAMAGQAL